MKYKSWILKETKLLPVSNNYILADDMGKIKRRVQYIYECPYCHQTFACQLNNEMTFRKCRACNHPVSPYRGEIVNEVFVDE